MKVAIFDPLRTVVPHFETELEIAQRHRDAGDRVEFVACLGGLECCDFNPDGLAERCADCVGRRAAGTRLLSGRVRVTPLALESPSAEIPPSIFGSIEQLKSYQIENFDVGYATLSSLVSICRDPEPDLAKYRGLVERLVRGAIATFRQTQHYGSTQRPDLVYVFNGRFAATRAVLRACQSLGIECRIHERGCDQNHFQIFENRLPHDIDYMQARIRAAWSQAAGDPRREAIAVSWFTDRVARVERNWKSFVKDQVVGRLPLNWDATARNVAVFTSSEDEFVSIGDSWRNRLYPSQLEALRSLIADLPRLDSRTRLTIRVHPNLRGVENSSTRGIMGLAGPRVAVIAAGDVVDSYELLRRSDAVVTFGSSIGIEAVFWERPSIVLGPSFYQGFPGLYEPDSHDALIGLLSKLLPPQSDRSGALMYGYWFQTHGEPFKYFAPDGLFSGKYRGQLVYADSRPGRWARMSGKFGKLLARPAA
jgi:hypothetical protein